jgi:Na+-transporting NADH:ubiquinone oxidoreductase subunit NqrF
MCSLGPTNQDSERNLGAGAGFALLVYLKSAIFVASDCCRCGCQRRRSCSLVKGGTPRKAGSITKK